MRILAFDTSTEVLSVAVAEDGKELSSYHKNIGMKQSSLLVPVMEKVLKDARFSLKDMDAIALGIGPGSFTGLRIGVAAAKALSLASGVPVVSVPELDAIAHNFAGNDGYIAPLLDARKEKVYSAIYEADMGRIGRLTGHLLVGIDGLLDRLKGPTLFFGDGIKLYGRYMADKNPLAKFSKDNDWYPRAKTIAELAGRKLGKGLTENIDKLTPLYLHPKECNVRKR